MIAKYLPRMVDLLKRRRVFVAAALLGLLVLVVGAPVWAATGPLRPEQGTVPPPPIDPGGGSQQGSNRGDGEGGFPDATPTPSPALPESVPVTATTPSTVTGIVTAPKLNVRQGPGTLFPVVGSVVKDQRLQIQFRDETGTWWYTCCISGTTTSGWVSTLFIRPEFDIAQAATLIPLAGPQVGGTTATAGALVASPSGAQTGSVTATRLNLRAAPGLTAPIVGKLLKEERLQILSRNAQGDWWYVCCLAGTTTEGWVSAQFVAPDFDRAAASELLPVYGEQVHVVLPTPTPRPPAQPTAPAITLTSTLPLTTAALSTTTLELLLAQGPEWAAPGKTVSLSYVISNTGAVTASAVELRNELAPQFELIASTAQEAGGAIQTQGVAGGSSLLTALWPEVAPGEAVSLTIALAIAPEVAAGSVIDTLAAVAAINARSQSAGVSIGLPPPDLPDFQ